MTVYTKKNIVVLGILLWFQLSLFAQLSGDVESNPDRIPYLESCTFQYSQHVPCLACTEDIITYLLNKNLTTEQKSLIAGIKKLTFVVEIDGTIKQTLIVPNKIPSIDTIINKILRKSPSWMPAMKDGQAVRAIVEISLTTRGVESEGNYFPDLKLKEFSDILCGNYKKASISQKVLQRLAEETIDIKSCECNKLKKIIGITLACRDVNGEIILLNSKKGNLLTTEMRNALSVVPVGSFLSFKVSLEVSSIPVTLLKELEIVE